MCVGDSRQIYKILNNLRGNTNTSKKIVSINSISGNCITDESAIANEFNAHFSSIGINLAKNIPNQGITQSFDTPNFCMFNFPVTESEVHIIISNLQNKASSGVDGISNLVLKASPFAIVPILRQLIEVSFKSGHFPICLARAVVYPLYKEGSKLDVTNYRPISLLVTWSKVFERVMYNRVYNYLETNSLIYIKQFGFRKNHSTVDAITEVTEKFRLDKSRSQKYTAFLDLKKLLIHWIIRYYFKSCKCMG